MYMIARGLVQALPIKCGGDFCLTLMIVQNSYNAVTGLLIKNSVQLVCIGILILLGVIIQQM
jgi:hypothetical protein